MSECNHEHLIVVTTETVIQRFDHSTREWDEVTGTRVHGVQAIYCEDCRSDVTDEVKDYVLRNL